MAVESVLEWITTIIIEGEPVTTAMAVYSDSGALIGYGTDVTGMLSNGSAVTCKALTTGAGASTTTGVGLLATEVGAVGYALAPALGVLAGVGLYNLAPDFWTSVNQTLVDAGKTIGGKVVGYVDGDGVTHYDQEVVEIYKNAFIEAGIYDKTYEYPEQETEWTGTVPVDHYVSPLTVWTDITKTCPYRITFSSDTVERQFYDLLIDNSLKFGFFDFRYYSPNIGWSGSFLTIGFMAAVAAISNSVQVTHYTVYGRRLGDTGIEIHTIDSDGLRTITSWIGKIITREPLPTPEEPRDVIRIKESPINVETLQPMLQPDATYPSSTQTIPQTYPDWRPWTRPGIQDPMYPIEIPLPDITQQPAQDPSPTTYPDDYDKWFIENLPIPSPNPDPVAPVSPTDPDPSDPLVPPPSNPTTVTQPIEPNPPNPNEPDNPDLTPVVPVTPDTFQSTKLFTVYNPTSAQLDALGAYLWSTSIIELIEKMWQNPLDGIISLKEVYANPTVGANKNIILGYLDSNVPAPVVTTQFVRVSCGSVFVSEQNKNVTDYSPYASVHIYLPFIGIVTLDVDEVMNSTLRVEYCIDVYTGTCIAEIYVSRNPDVPVEKILYTFSGNCSQTLPLTGSDATGLMGSLASLSAAAIGIVAGGGAVSAAAGAAIGHSLTHEMLHIGHSSSLSSNAGIMGQKKPYVIIGRRFGYDANAYNEIYGYPTNKTVYLGNSSGYVKVKAINLQSEATSEEKDEIKSLLMNGVIM